MSVVSFTGFTVQSQWKLEDSLLRNNNTGDEQKHARTAWSRVVGRTKDAESLENVTTPWHEHPAVLSPLVGSKPYYCTMVQRKE